MIKGTRIPASLIVRKLSEGATEGDLCDGYPTLQPGDVRAALAYAADMLAHEVMVMQSAEPAMLRIRFLADESCEYLIVSTL